MSKVDISIFRGADQDSAEKVATVPVTRRTMLKTLRAALTKKGKINEEDVFHGPNGEVDEEKEGSLKVVDHIIERDGEKMVVVITPEEELEVNSVDDEEDLDVQSVKSDTEAGSKSSKEVKVKKGKDVIPIPKLIASGGAGTPLKSQRAVAETAENMKARLQHFEIEGNVSDDIRDTVTSITPAELYTVLERANVGKAYSIEGEKPEARDLKVIKDLPLPVRGGFNRAAIAISVKDDSVYESEVTYTSRATAYAKNGWTKASLSVGTPWVSGSMEYSTEEAQARASEQKNMTVTAYWRLPRCTITLPIEENLTLNPSFIEAIEEAVERPNGREMVASTLRRWGHVLPTEITLGAVKRTTKTLNETSSSNEEQKKEEIKASLDAKIKNFEIGASLGHGTGSATSNAERTGSESLYIESLGGDSLLIGENQAGAWVKSVAKWQYWRIIEIKHVIPVLGLLPADLLDKVKQLEPKPKEIGLSPAELEKRIRAEEEEIMEEKRRRREHDMEMEQLKKEEMRREEKERARRLLKSNPILGSMFGV